MTGINNAGPSTMPLARPMQPAAKRKEISWFKIISWSVIGLLVFFILYPLLTTLLSVMGIDAGQWQFLRVLAVWQNPETIQSLVNLLILVVVSGSLAVLIGSFFAWVNTRTDARIGWAARILPLVPLLVPAIASAVGWVFLTSPGAGFLNQWTRELLSVVGVHLQTGPFDIFTWPGLIFMYVLFLTPYAYLSVSNGLEALDPSLEEAARVGGVGPVGALFKVVLPNLVPALGSAIAQVITIGFALFAAPVVIGTAAGIEVLPVSIVYAMTREFPSDTEAAIGMALVLVLLVVMVTLSLRKIVDKGNYAKIGGRGSRDNLVKLGKAKWVIRSLMVLYLVFTSVLPFVGLVLVSLQGFWSPNFNFAAATLANYENVLQGSIVRASLLNSLVLGLATASAVTIIVAITAYWINRSNTRLNRGIDAIVKIPVAIPHIVVGLAFLVAFSAQPLKLTGTLVILLLVYIVVFLPQASFYANTAVQQIGGEMVEAAAVSGAREGRTFLTIIAPLMVPSLVSAWTLVFVVGASEVNASSLLAGPATPVIGVSILELFNAGTYPRLAALGVIITLISSAVIITVIAVRARRARPRRQSRVRKPTVDDDAG